MPPEFERLMESVVGGGWTRFGDGAYAPLGRALRGFDLRATVAAVAGLLTVPVHQPGTIRLEVLLHLAVVHCRGDRAPTLVDVRGWVEEMLAALPVRRAEDPVEDVCVSNVIAPGGNYRLFQGVWESSDRWLQAVLDAFLHTAWGRDRLRVLAPVVALLRLSDAAAERAGLARWASPDRAEAADAFLAPDLDLPALQQRMTFTTADLTTLGVAVEDLRPFLLPPTARGRVRAEALGHSTLERFPLLAVEGGLVLALPTAVSPAARRYVVEECARRGELPAFRGVLRDAHYHAVVEEALRHVDAPDGVGRLLLPTEGLPRPTGPVHWDEVLCPIDEDKLAQVLLLHPLLDGVVQVGLDTPADLGAAEANLVRHMEATARHLAPHAAGGLTVLVIGGVGGGLMLPYPTLPAGWHCVVMSAANFETFAWSRDASLLRLWKLQEQAARLTGAGVQIVETNDALTTYAYWAGHGFAFCPAEFPFPPAHPGLLTIGTDLVRSFRLEERRRHDVHAVPVDAADTALRVRRLGPTAIFPSMLGRPIYVADELLRRGELAGVYEHPELSVWVWAAAPEDPPAVREFVYQLWEGLLSWLDRLVPQLTALLEPPPRAGRPAPVVHVRLAVSDEPGWQHFTEPGHPPEARPMATLDAQAGVVAITVPFGFIPMLRRPANDGERALLEVVSEALVTWLTRDAAGPGAAPQATEAEALVIAHQAVRDAMCGEGTRFLHMFDAAGPTDELAVLRPGRAKSPRFLFPEDQATWEDGLAWSVVDRATLGVLRAPAPEGEAAGAAVPAAEPPPSDVVPSAAPPTPNAGPRASAGPVPNAPSDAGPGQDLDDVRELVGDPACTAALGALVDVLWTDLRDRLREINGPSLVTRAVENSEAIFRDREHWRRTSSALLALYGETDEVGRISAERDGRRSAAGNAARVLAEMAVCTCPRDGGRAASLADYDRLVAGVHLLIEAAFDSDAIHHGLAEPRLRVHPNGTIDADRGFVAALLNPFAVEVHSADFRAAADGYAELYRPRHDSTLAPAGPDDPAPLADGDPELPALFAPDFVAAFTAEYGIAPSRLLDGLAELVGLGLEGGSLVVSSTRGAVAGRLAEARGFTAQEATAFFGMLALVPRDDWAVTPKGFRARDWQPWRFRRRLSVVARPLVTFGGDDAAPLIFGMYQLGASVSYLFENMRSAWLPEEFFRSRAMIRFRGSVVNAEGAAFTQDVAARLRDAGWEVRTEVLMSTLGASPELGDLDVVAWRAGDDRLLLIECKRLQPARTVGEIGELLTQFRGETGDRLGRHVRRCDWVREHMGETARALGLPDHGRVVAPLLVTNRDVPMRFRTDLPLSPNQIVPLGGLVDRVGQSPGR